MSALIEFEEVCKYYQMGDTTVKAADHITMKIDKGEFVAIVGQSGSGKSTCMNIIGCLDVPTHGVYRLNGRDVGKMSRNELAAVRNEMLGFIFQQYNLLPRLNLMENVEVPLVYAGVSRAERHARAREVLEQVGLGDKLKNRPNQLSAPSDSILLRIRLLEVVRVCSSTNRSSISHSLSKSCPRVSTCRGFLRNRFSILYSIGDRVRGLPFREAVCSEKSRNSRPSS